MCTLHISNLTQSPSYKIWTKLNKYCLYHYSLTQLKVELGCLNSADTGANKHTAMTLVEMSKIIFNLFITILFIVDIGEMAPICVRMLGCTPMET